MLNFVSYDNKFIIKAITKQEQNLFLHDKISLYYDRVMNKSHIQHIYGIFKLIIKGQIYRLMLVENYSTKFIYRNSIDIYSGSYDEQSSSLIDNKFIMDESEKRRFEDILNEDIGYLRVSDMHTCRILIEIVGELIEYNTRNFYSGIYQGKHRYLIMSISNISYSSIKTKYKQLKRSSIELKVDTRNLNNIESRIRNYIE